MMKIKISFYGPLKIYFDDFNIKTNKYTTLRSILDNIGEYRSMLAERIKNWKCGLTTEAITIYLNGKRLIPEDLDRMLPCLDNNELDFHYFVIGG